MKGLLYKDGMTLIRSYRVYLLVCAGFILFSAVKPENIFWAPYGIFFLSTIVSSLSTLDEQMKWLSYIDILPVTRKEVVTERYLLNALLTFAATAVFLILGLVLKNSDLPTVLATAVMMIALSFFTSAIFLPVNIKFGSVKSQMVRMAVMLVMIVCCMTVISYSGSLIDMISRISPTVLFLSVLIGVIVLYSISWLVSVRIFENKDL